jgi:hypothetical protein
VNLTDPFGLDDEDPYGPQTPYENEDRNPGSFWAEHEDGRIYNPYGGQALNGQVVGGELQTDRVFSDANWNAPGPWGEHPLGSSNYGPNDHGTSGSSGNNQGGGGGNAANGPISGSAPISFVLPTTSGSNRMFVYDRDWLNNQLTKYGREHRSELDNLKQFGDFMNAYAMNVAKVMTLPALGPAARLTIAYLATTTLYERDFVETADFVTELAGVPGPPPTTVGGTMGFGWRKYGKFMLSEDGSLNEE